MVRNFVFSKNEHPVSFQPPHVSTNGRNHADSSSVKLQEGGADHYDGKDMTRSHYPPGPLDDEVSAPVTTQEDDDDDDEKNKDMAGPQTPTARQGRDSIAIDLSASHEHATRDDPYIAHNLVSDDESSPDASSKKVPSSTVAATAAASPQRASFIDIAPTLSSNTKASPSRSLAGANALIEMLKQEQDKRMEKVAELKGQNSELLLDKKELEDMLKNRDKIIEVLQMENAALSQANQEAEKHATDLTSVLLLANQAHDILGGMLLHRSAALINGHHPHNDAGTGNDVDSNSNVDCGRGNSDSNSDNNNSSSSKSIGRREAETPGTTKTVGGSTVMSPSFLEPPLPPTPKKSTTAVAGSKNANSSKTAAKTAATTTTTTTTMAASSVPDGENTSNYNPPPASLPFQLFENELMIRIRQHWNDPDSYPLDNIDLEKVGSAWKPRVTDPRQEVMTLSNSSNSNNEEETKRFEKGEIVGKGDRGWTVEFPNGDTTNTYKKCLFPHPDLILGLHSHDL